MLELGLEPYHVGLACEPAIREVFCGGALITPRFVLTGTLALDEKMTSVVYYSQGFKGYMFSKQPYLIELKKI